MQFNDPLASPPPAPQGSPAPEQITSALRGLDILRIALVVTLCASVIGGVARTYLMDQIWNHGQSASSVSSLLSMVFGAWQLIFIGTAIAELIALGALAGAPPQARVTDLARTALGLVAVGLVLSLFSSNAYLFLRSMMETRQTAQLLQYVGYADTAVDLAGRILIVEVVLRLRTFAAPTDRSVAENESSLRAALVTALVVQIIANYGSHLLTFRTFGSGSAGQWAGFAVRLAFSLLVSGLLLWLVQATATALRTAKLDSAVAPEGDPLAALPTRPSAAETSASAYRNLLLGALWAIGGLALTAITYESAQKAGGRYVIAYGAVAGGIIQFIRGMIQLSRRE